MITKEDIMVPWKFLMIFIVSVMSLIGVMSYRYYIHLSQTSDKDLYTPNPEAAYLSK